MTTDAIRADTITVEPLSAEAFAPFGEVIEHCSGTRISTNGGTAIRAHAISAIDCGSDGGTAYINMFHVPKPVPIEPVRMLERHPISTQAFIPLERVRFIVVVADASVVPSHGALRAFLTDGRQGVNYLKGTWHHALIALDPGSLLVIDRSTSAQTLEQDYDEYWLRQVVALSLPSDLLS